MMMMQMQRATLIRSLWGHSPFNHLNLSTRSFSVSMALPSSSSSSSSLSNKQKRKARRDSPESVLKHNLDMCSKNNDLFEALRLYDQATQNGTPLSLHHYNVLLYLCSSSQQDDLALERGFQIFHMMDTHNIPPNEATFTNLARLALAKQDPQMAFDLIKRMHASGILPRLRSYGPALFGFCDKGDADTAYEVDAHMLQSGVVPEEPELSALFRVSAHVNRPHKVYQLLHRLRAAVRQVTQDTARIIEDWFASDGATQVGMENPDMAKVKEAVITGGGGWHGQGWLGTGKWTVVRTQLHNTGVCPSCGHQLVAVDIDPKETDNFATSLATLAFKKEVKAEFVRFQKWLEQHGPFDAVVDGANVGLVNAQNFNFSQLNAVVNQLREISPSKKSPLVILHKSRVFGGPAQIPRNKKLLDAWRMSGALYATPPGSNDDWYWLYAAVSSKCLLVTNDEMRDHLFQLLGNSFFPRWKERHQVRLSVSRNGIALCMPPPYSIVIQESEEGSWHIPTVTGDDLETPREWLCATRTRRRIIKSPRAKAPTLSNLFSAGSS